jgi:uncharacterized protein
MNPANIDVEHEPAVQRFIARVDGELAELNYDKSAGRIVIEHVGVPVASRRRGVAARLMVAALEYATREQLAVVPQCPYAYAFIRRHPEYRPLVDRR